MHPQRTEKIPLDWEEPSLGPSWWTDSRVRVGQKEDNTEASLPPPGLQHTAAVPAALGHNHVLPADLQGQEEVMRGGGRAAK